MSRGVYGHPTASRSGRRCYSVGAQPGTAFDAARAVKQIDAEMETIIDALYRAMGVDPAAVRRPASPDEAWMARARAAKAKAQQSPLWSYFDDSISPKYGDWGKVSEGFQGKPMTPEDYDRWLARVTQLRADVRSKGIKLKSPDPVNLFQGPAAVGDAGKVVKWTAIGALVIGGVVAISALASSSRRTSAPRASGPYGYLVGSY